MITLPRGYGLTQAFGVSVYGKAMLSAQRWPLPARRKLKREPTEGRMCLWWRLRCIALLGITSVNDFCIYEACSVSARAKSAL